MCMRFVRIPTPCPSDHRPKPPLPQPQLRRRRACAPRRAGHRRGGAAGLLPAGVRGGARGQRRAAGGAPAARRGPGRLVAAVHGRVAVPARYARHVQVRTNSRGFARLSLRVRVRVEIANAKCSVSIRADPVVVRVCWGIGAGHADPQEPCGADTKHIMCTVAPHWPPAWPRHGRQLILHSSSTTVSIAERNTRI